MTTATQTAEYTRSNAPKLNEQVIVVGRDNMPAVRTVTRVTPSGKQFSFDGGDVRYQMECVSRAKAKNSFNNEVHVYPYSDARLLDVQSMCQNRIDAATAKRLERESREAAVRTREEMETQRIRTLVNFSEMVPTVLPDGSRLFQHTFPARICTVQMADGTTQTEDRGWLHVIVSCRTVQERDWDAERLANGDRPLVDRTEFALTYRDARNGSFSSCSTEKKPNDEAAVYEALRWAYHRAW